MVVSISNENQYVLTIDGMKDPHFCCGTMLDGGNVPIRTRVLKGDSESVDRISEDEYRERGCWRGDRVGYQL